MTKNEFNGSEAISKARELKEINSDPEKWETLYQDKVTGELWLLDYPNSELHGGGSPRLRKHVDSKEPE